MTYRCVVVEVTNIIVAIPVPCSDPEEAMSRAVRAVNDLCDLTEQDWDSTSFIRILRTFNSKKAAFGWCEGFNAAIELADERAQELTKLIGEASGNVTSN